MAKVLTNDDLLALKKFDLPKGYQRTGQFPLDPSSIFASKADAELYAAGGVDARGLGGTSYAGQIVSVVENGGVAIYIIDTAGTLQAVGGDVAADLTNLTSKVNAILEGADDELNSFAEVKAKFDNLKDLVVESGEVRKPTTEEAAANQTLNADDEYVVLTIKNGTDKIFINVNSLVDEIKLGTDEVTTKLLSYKDSTLTVSEEGYQQLWETALSESETALTKTAADENYAPKTIVETVNGHSTTLTGLETKVTANEASITTLKETVGDDEKGLVKSVNDLAQSLSAFKVKDVDTTASNGVNLTLSTEGKVGVNVAADTLAAAIVKSSNFSVSTDSVLASSAYTSKKTGLQYLSENASLTETLKTYADAIDSAYADVISNDKAISVSGRTAGGVDEIPHYTVSLNVADNTNLSIGDNGLELVWLDE